MIQICKPELPNSRTENFRTFILLNVDLLFYHRAFTGFHEKFAFVDEVAVAFLAEMNNQVFYTDGVAFRDVGNIAMADIMAVYNDHQSAANGFHLIAIC